jgi:hypothetical protein
MSWQDNGSFRALIGKSINHRPQAMRILSPQDLRLQRQALTGPQAGLLSRGALAFNYRAIIAVGRRVMAPPAVSQWNRSQRTVWQ